jgi:hypothetical protein
MTLVQLQQKAQFATSSRLICCLVNERLVQAWYFPHGSRFPPGTTPSFPNNKKRHDQDHLPQGWMQLIRRESITQDPTIDTLPLAMWVPLRHVPQIPCKPGERIPSPSLIHSVDPDDLHRPSISFVLQTFHGNTMQYQDILSPSLIWNTVADWNQLDKASKVVILSELESSVTVQGTAV